VGLQITIDYLNVKDIQNVLFNLKNLYAQLSGTLTVDGCNIVASQSTSGAYNFAENSL
jgi:hypothetical protein